MWNSLPSSVVQCSHSRRIGVNHAKIILITHKFWVKHLHSRTYFSLKNVEHHHFSSFNCESVRPNDFCSPEESQKSLF